MNRLKSTGYDNGVDKNAKTEGGEKRWCWDDGVEPLKLKAWCNDSLVSRKDGQQSLMIHDIHQQSSSCGLRQVYKWRRIKQEKKH